MSKKINVMLIDDNKIDLFIHNEFVKKMNVLGSITQFCFAKEALAFLKTKGSDEWPDLILLDIHMPIMNGFEFLDEFAQLPVTLRQKCSIVIVSSSLDNIDHAKAEENKLVLALFEKPLNIKRLTEFLQENKII
ncbi:MAG: regulator [Bacteroidota bacterium]|jgi:response regulator of citrate/malate metabolism|nr:regulator [Bacteroidota bacterium]